MKANVSKARLAAYAAAGAGAAMGAVGSAEAAITYVPVNQLVQDTTLDTFATGIDLTFLGANAVTYHLAMVHGIGTADATTGVASVRPEAFGAPGVNVAGFASGVYNYASNVTYGAAVNTLPSFLPASATLAFNGGFTFSEFKNPGIGFVGVRFNANQYGWVRVDMGGTPLNKFTVVDYAYGGPGETLQAGVVPEPGSLGALAMGALGLATWRKNRKPLAA